MGDLHHQRTGTYPSKLINFFFFCVSLFEGVLPPRNYSSGYSFFNQAGVSGVESSWENSVSSGTLDCVGGQLCPKG